MNNLYKLHLKVRSVSVGKLTYLYLGKNIL